MHHSFCVCHEEIHSIRQLTIYADKVSRKWEITLLLYLFMGWEDQGKEIKGHACGRQSS